MEIQGILVSADVRKMDEDEFTEIVQQFIHCHYAFIFDYLSNLNKTKMKSRLSTKLRPKINYGFSMKSTKTKTREISEKKQIKTILKITDKYLASSIYFWVKLLTSKLYHQNVLGGNPDSISAKFELTP